MWNSLLQVLVLIEDTLLNHAPNAEHVGLAKKGDYQSLRLLAWICASHWSRQKPILVSLERNASISAGTLLQGSPTRKKTTQLERHNSEFGYDKSTSPSKNTPTRTPTNVPRISHGTSPRSQSSVGGEHKAKPAVAMYNDPPPLHTEVALELFNHVLNVMPLSDAVEYNPYYYLELLNADIGLNDIFEMITQNPQDLQAALAEAGAQVIAYLSATNYSIIQQKLNENWVNWKQTTGIGFHHSPTEATTDYSNLIRCYATDYIRTINKRALYNTVDGLRFAIWSFIEHYSAEFAQLWKKKQNLVNTDVLFEFLYANADSQRKKNLYWPLMTAIIIISAQDICSPTEREACTKKLHFIDSLQKNFKSKTPEQAMVCIVALQKASTYTIREPGAALRILAHSFETVVFERVFDPKASYPKDEDDGFGVQQMIDAVFALSKLNPLYTVNTALPMLLDSQNILHRSIFANVCFLIQRLNWDHAIDPKLGVYMRSCFLQHQILKAKKIEKLDKKHQSEENLAKTDKKVPDQTIFILLAAFIGDISLVLGPDQLVPFDQIRQLVKELVYYLVDPSPRIRHMSANALLCLVDHENILQIHGDQKEKISYCWKMVSQALILISRQLLASNNPEAKQPLLIRELTQVCLTMLQKRSELQQPQESIPQKFAAFVSMEAAFSVLLTFPDADISKRAGLCLGFLLNEAEQDQSSPFASMILNSQCYRELAAVLDDGDSFGVYNNKVRQKQIRHALKYLVSPTPGNLAAWEELYRIWRFFFSNIIKDGFISIAADPLQEEKSEKKPSQFMDIPDWTNVTGYLCATGHLCLLATNQSVSISEDMSKHDLHLEKQLTQSYSQARSTLEAFIKELVSLLSCNNLVVRETAKELLGNELVGESVSILFSHLESASRRLLSSEGEIVINDRNIIHIDNALSIIKFVVDRADELFAVAPENSQVYLTPKSVDVGNFLLLFSRYCYGIIGDLGHSQIMMRIKIRLGHLLVSFLSKKDLIGLVNEQPFRNELANYFLEWNSEFLRPPNQSASFSDKMQTDLDLASMSALRSLLKDMRLQSKEVDEDANAKLFLKYLGFFLKAFETSKSSVGLDVPAQMNANPELYKLLAKSKESLRALTQIKEDAINGLANLIASNLDIALKRFVARIFDPDPKMRSVFLQVLIQVLSLGSAEKFSGIQESASKFKPLVDLLVSSSELTQMLTQSLASAGPEAAQTMYDIWMEEGKLTQLIIDSARAEINQTDVASNVFRRNSVASRLLTIYSNSEMTQFLHRTIEPIIEQLASGQNINYEMDPDRTDPNFIPVHKLSLEQLTQSFLDAIFENVQHFPNGLRFVCSHLYQMVESKFSGTGWVAVGGLVFLRVICPAIATPSTPIQNPNLKRGLILVTKVIQNLSNFVLFGGKEYFMEPLNPLVQQNQNKVLKFLQTEPLDYQEQPERRDNYLNHLRLLYLTHSLKDQIQQQKQLNQVRKRANTVMQRGHPNQNKSDVEKLMLILNDLPPPSQEEMEKLNRKTMTSNVNQARPLTMYHDGSKSSEFIAKESAKDHSQMYSLMRERKIFYSANYSRENRLVMYFNVKRLMPREVDMNSFIYCLISLVQQTNASFDLLVDFTRFGPQNEWPPVLVDALEKLSPKINLQNLILLNVNSYCKNHLKRLSRFQPLKHCKKVFVVSKLTELHELIAPDQLQLHPETTEIMEATFKSFSSITCTQERNTWQANVSISDKYLALFSAKKQDILNGQGIFVDHFLLENIDQLRYGKGTQNQATAVFQFNEEDGDTMIQLEWSKAVGFIELVKSNISRLALVQKPSDQGQIESGDVQASMLNIALLHLANEDPSLRSSSYSLLSSICRVYEYDIRLSDSIGAAVPWNIQRFASQVSGAIAQTEKDLSVEFIKECYAYINRDLPWKEYMISYVSPWIDNLEYCLTPNEGSTPQSLEQGREKVKQMLRLLLSTTMRHFLEFQMYIWNRVAKQEQVLELLLDIAMEDAVGLPFNSQQLEMLNNTIVTVSTNAGLLGGLLKQTRELLSFLSNTPEYFETVQWKSLTINLRFLLHSTFENENVWSFLPEILFNCSLVCGLGSPFVRRTVHAILCNLIQAMSVMHTHQEQKSQCHQILKRVDEPKHAKVFGLEGRVQKYESPAFVVNSESINGESVFFLPFPEQMYVASLVSGLAELMDKEGTTIHQARLMSLFGSTAFGTDIALQGMSLVCIGYLTKEFDPNLVNACLMTLKACFESAENRKTVMISALICLSKIISTIYGPDQHLNNLFWCALSLCRVEDTHLFEYSLGLLSVLVSVMEDESITIEDIKQAREHVRWTDIDVNTQQHLGISFSSILMRGLLGSTTKETTVGILHQLLRLSVKSNPESNESILEFAIPLLPLVPLNDLIEATQLSTRETIEHRLADFLSAFLMQNSDSRFLQLQYLMVYLEQTRHDNEIILISLRVQQHISHTVKTTRLTHIHLAIHDLLQYLPLDAIENAFPVQEMIASLGMDRLGSKTLVYSRYMDTVRPDRQDSFSLSSGLKVEIPLKFDDDRYLECQSPISPFYPSPISEVHARAMKRMSLLRLQLGYLSAPISIIPQSVLSNKPFDHISVNISARDEQSPYHLQLKRSGRDAVISAAQDALQTDSKSLPDSSYLQNPYIRKVSQSCTFRKPQPQDRSRPLPAFPPLSVFLQSMDSSDISQPSKSKKRRLNDDIEPMRSDASYYAVLELGGYQMVTKKRKWKRVAAILKIPTSLTSSSYTLRTYYEQFLLDFETQYMERIVELDSVKAEKAKSEINKEWDLLENTLPPPNPDWQQNLEKARSRNVSPISELLSNFFRHYE
ncbi:hypothetical protein EDD86DRAFT_243749 [Gorgonomyces haynaldii]|nr:hypothetical protein EDD86DRAFT_243749 [Gorgonomyces haynaldii]